MAGSPSAAASAIGMKCSAWSRSPRRAAFSAKNSSALARTWGRPSRSLMASAVAGVPGGLIEFEQRVGRRRRAGGRAPRPCSARRARPRSVGPAVSRPVPGVAEQLNRAQFVQRPQPPDRQPGRVGDGEGTARKRAFAAARSRIRSLRPGDLQGVAAYLGCGPAGVQRSAGQPAAPAPGRRLPARPRLPAPPLGRSAPGPGWKRRRPAATARCSRVAGHRVASAAAWASRRCTRARARALALPGAEPGEQAAACGHGLIRPPGQRQRFHRAPSARARCSPGPSMAAARRSVSTAVASAPWSSAAPPEAVEQGPARPVSPAWTARSAAASRHGSARSGWAASTAASAAAASGGAAGRQHGGRATASR